ncbi:hypothetical protein ACU61A_15715 [Pseudonocardia sichuanensis]
MRTGIPPSTWADEGEQAITTALHLLRGGDHDAAAQGGPQMSG